MSLGKSNLWVFFLGSGPVFVVFCFLLFASLFPLAKRKSGWGICASCLVVFCGFSVLYCLICLLKMDISCPCTNVFPTAYVHVRTEPLARHRPNSRKKKVGGSCFVDDLVSCWGKRGAYRLLLEPSLKVAFYYFVSSGGLIVCC